MTISGLDAEKSYTVAVDGFADNYAATIAKSENAAGDSWKAVITSAIKQLALLFENPSKERCCVLS